eukprot:298678-Rhodomonas_salina.1
MPGYPGTGYWVHVYLGYTDRVPGELAGTETCQTLDARAEESKGHDFREGSSKTSFCPVLWFVEC